MPTETNRLLFREDTLLGVCEGIGQDTGISPTLLRIGFTGLLFWNPVLSVASYVGLALAIYAVRWLLPNRTADQSRTVRQTPAAPAAREEEPELALAA